MHRAAAQKNRRSDSFKSSLKTGGLEIKLCDTSPRTLDTHRLFGRLARLLLLLPLNGVLAGLSAASIQIDSIDHSLEQGINANPLLQTPATATNTNTAGTLVIDTSKKYQTFAGIGAAFSEIGGLALAGLPEASRDALLTSLFNPVKGAGFSMCRLPVGSSDFATNAYSYADTPWDLGMAYFSLARDEKSIIPAAQGALKKNPALRFFASP